MTPRKILGALERLVHPRRSTGPTILASSSWFTITHRPEAAPACQVEATFTNGAPPLRLGPGDADELGVALQESGLALLPPTARAHSEAYRRRIVADPAQLAGRYWPTSMDAPRKADGSVDIAALCRHWDDEVNGR